jgi:hypothetical protein
MPQPRFALRQLPDLAKFPDPPASINGIKPAWLELAAGKSLARIYAAQGLHPVSWREFRFHGPLHGRFDPQRPAPGGGPRNSRRGVLYAAGLARTCIAEVFQARRVVNRIEHGRCLAVFDLTSPLRLLDLRGSFATRMGASAAIHSGNRIRAQAWARLLYDTWPEADGIAYCSSMDGNRDAYALWERSTRALPSHPRFNRPLLDPTLTDLIAAAAADLGYLLD